MMIRIYNTLINLDKVQSIYITKSQEQKIERITFRFGLDKENVQTFARIQGTSARPDEEKYHPVPDSTLIILERKLREKHPDFVADA